MNRYVLNETSYFGAGCRTELATEVKTKGYKKALLVSDRVLASCGVLDKVKDVLNKAEIPFDEFLEISKIDTPEKANDLKTEIYEYSKKERRFYYAYRNKENKNSLFSRRKICFLCRR